MTPNERLFGAIFGVTPAQTEFLLAEKASEKEKDIKEAKGLARQANENLAWASVEWSPVMYYGNPAAMAAINGEIQMAIPNRKGDWSYSQVHASDLWAITQV